ncbi:restriction endonuclease subunit S [Flavobacterium daejeonense]|uniref:restriction endonuclease subunit S n=1 Tax=Flavobacterium daejeonense TaxID=350893 RepID=UPI000AA57E76|nr:restriction endonuclease subunit S [Flavobacterium daejeonense]
MQKVKFKELFSFEKKSKIKAGDGFKFGEGKYPFYTSSDTLSKTLNDFLFKDESLIFGTGGLASIHHCDEKFAVSTDCFVTQAKNKKETFTKFVYYYLSGNMHLLENGFKGAGLKHISKGYIEDLMIPLPPLPTQQKIAAILDKADELCQYNNQLIEKYDTLTQSLFLEMFGDPVKNEKGWKITTFSKILSKIESGWSPVCENKPRTSDKEWAVLKLGAVSYSIYNSKENKKCEFEVPISKLDCEVKKGDLLFTRKNTYHMVGTTAFVYETEPRLLLPDTVFRLVYIKEKSNPLFLYYLLNNNKFSAEIQSLASGTSGSMPNISKAKLLAKETILPPVDLQNQFAERVLLIELQKKQAQEALAKSEELFQSLLQKAFKEEFN